MLGGRVTSGATLQVWKPSAMSAVESARLPSARGAVPRSPAGRRTGALPLWVAPDLAPGPSGQACPTRPERAEPPTRASLGPQTLLPKEGFQAGQGGERWRPCHAGSCGPMARPFPGRELSVL